MGAKVTSSHFSSMHLKRPIVIHWRRILKKSKMQTLPLCPCIKEFESQWTQHECLWKPKSPETTAGIGRQLPKTVKISVQGFPIYVFWKRSFSYSKYLFVETVKTPNGMNVAYRLVLFSVSPLSNPSSEVIFFTRDSFNLDISLVQGNSRKSSPCFS